MQPFTIINFEIAPIVPAPSYSNHFFQCLNSTFGEGPGDVIAYKNERFSANMHIFRYIFIFIRVYLNMYLAPAPMPVAELSQYLYIIIYI